MTASRPGDCFLLNSVGTGGAGGSAGGNGHFRLHQGFKPTRRHAS